MQILFQNNTNSNSKNIQFEIYYFNQMKDHLNLEIHNLRKIKWNDNIFSFILSERVREFQQIIYKYNHKTSLNYSILYLKFKVIFVKNKNNLSRWNEFFLNELTCLNTKIYHLILGWLQAITKLTNFYSRKSRSTAITLLTQTNLD